MKFYENYLTIFEYGVYTHYLHIFQNLQNIRISDRLTQEEKDCLGGDETTGYCIPQYKPCSCKDGSLYDVIVEITHGIGHCEEELSVAEFICVPGYEKCLKKESPYSLICLPSFEKKSDECEDNIWNKLYEKLLFQWKNSNGWNEPSVVPCMDFEEPTDNDSRSDDEDLDDPDQIPDDELDFGETDDEQIETDFLPSIL